MKLQEKEYLDELINSGITLTAKESKVVEEYLWSIQEPVSAYQLNSARGRAECGLGSPWKKHASN